MFLINFSMFVKSGYILSSKSGEVLELILRRTKRGYSCDQVRCYSVCHYLWDVLPLSLHPEIL